MDTIEIVVLSLLGVWLVVLTLFSYQTASHYKKLIGKTKEKDLKRVLEKILSQLEGDQKEVANLGRQINKLEKDGQLHIQRVGLVRFNPFNETGGDHSFTIALLNARDDGVVITGLHARDRTRVYLKAVKGGKSQHDLSKEELKAIKEAK